MCPTVEQTPVAVHLTYLPALTPTKLQSSSWRLSCYIVKVNLQVRREAFLPAEHGPLPPTIRHKQLLENCLWPVVPVLIA